MRIQNSFELCFMQSWRAFLKLIIDKNFPKRLFSLLVTLDVFYAFVPLILNLKNFLNFFLADGFAPKRHVGKVVDANPFFLLNLFKLNLHSHLVLFNLMAVFHTFCKRLKFINFLLFGWGLELQNVLRLWLNTHFLYEVQSVNNVGWSCQRFAFHWLGVEVCVYVRGRRVDVVHAHDRTLLHNADFVFEMGLFEFHFV